jgi:hypothetical protein
MAGIREQETSGREKAREGEETCKSGQGGAGRGRMNRACTGTSSWPGANTGSRYLRGMGSRSTAQACGWRAAAGESFRQRFVGGAGGCVCQRERAPQHEAEERVQVPVHRQGSYSASSARFRHQRTSIGTPGLCCVGVQFSCIGCSLQMTHARPSSSSYSAVLLYSLV